MKKLSLVLLITICFLPGLRAGQKVRLQFRVPEVINGDTVKALNYTNPNLKKIFQTIYKKINTNISTDTVYNLFIPKTVKQIDDDVLHSRFFSSIDSVIVDENNPNFSSQLGILYDKHKTALLYCPPYKVGEVIFPSTLKELNAYSFLGCAFVTSLILNDSVKINNIVSLRFCKKLSRLEVSANSPYYSSLDGVLYNKEQTKAICFPLDMQNDIHIPSTIKEIERLFPVVEMEESIISYGKNITIYIPSTVKIVHDNAFKGCEATIKIPRENSIQTIGDGAFAETKIDSITLDSIKYIGHSAFYKSSLKSVVITSDSLKTIWIAAFRDCSNLTSITLPKSDALIVWEALASPFQVLTVGWHKPFKTSKKDYVFGKTDLSQCTLRVPKGTRRAYRKAPVWKDFGHIVEVE